MRVTCPHCKKEVSLEDKSAESAVPCPLCGNIFTAPSLMMALPMEPKPAPPPPPAATPVAAPPAAVTVPAAPKVETTSAGPQTTPAQSCRVTLRKSVVTWMGPIALLVLFFLTFFNWIGAYPAGIAVYTQSAWQVMAGGFTTEPADEVFGREKELRDVVAWSPSMLLMLLLLLVAAIIAGLDLAEEYVTFAVPDIIQKVWPHRLKFLAAVSLMIFGLLSALCLSGLGMESKMAAMAELVIPTPKPDPNAPADSIKQKNTREWQRAKEIAQLGVRRTWGWRLAYTASAIAVVGFGLELMLRNRGRRPEPVLELHY